MSKFLEQSRKEQIEKLNQARQAKLDKQYSLSKPSSLFDTSRKKLQTNAKPQAHATGSILSNLGQSILNVSSSQDSKQQNDGINALKELQSKLGGLQTSLLGASSLHARTASASLKISRDILDVKTLFHSSLWNSLSDVQLAHSFSKSNMHVVPFESKSTSIVASAASKSNLFLAAVVDTKNWGILVLDKNLSLDKAFGTNGWIPVGTPSSVIAPAMQMEVDNNNLFVLCGNPSTISTSPTPCNAALFVLSIETQSILFKTDLGDDIPKRMAVSKDECILLSQHDVTFFTWRVFKLDGSLRITNVVIEMDQDKKQETHPLLSAADIQVQDGQVTVVGTVLTNSTPGSVSGGLLYAKYALDSGKVLVKPSMYQIEGNALTNAVGIVNQMIVAQVYDSKTSNAYLIPVVKDTPDVKSSILIGENSTHIHHILYDGKNWILSGVSALNNRNWYASYDGKQVTKPTFSWPCDIKEISTMNSSVVFDGHIYWSGYDSKTNVVVAL